MPPTRRSTVPAAIAAAALLALPAAPALAAQATGSPTGEATQVSGPANPGFEADGTATARPAAWHSTGRPGLARTEPDGHTGGFALIQSDSAPFGVETAQRVSAPRGGFVTLTAWTRTSTAAGASYIALRHCGDDEQRATLPPSAQWIRIVVS